MSVYQTKSGMIYVKKESMDKKVLVLLMCLMLNPTKEELLNPENWKEKIVLTKIYDLE